MADANWKVVVPSQGINFHGSTSKLEEFLNKEIAYYQRLAIDGQQIVMGSNGLGTINLSSLATDQLSKIVSEIREKKTGALDRYIAGANSLSILIGSGKIGESIEKGKAISPQVGAVSAAVYCVDWIRINNNALRDYIYTLRTVALSGPTAIAFNDILAADHISQQAIDAQQRSESDAEELTKFISEKTSLVSELESLYRNRLTIQEPAVSWKAIASAKTVQWQRWLIFFGVMACLPIVLALVEREALATFISHISAASSNGFSLTGLAVITVPALFYAWLLKNISRVFIQNLNLADDASHRRSLALTYMGLLQDEKHPALEQERAIILNALFRPIPPQTNDEGPPAGLIDLISKKP